VATAAFVLQELPPPSARVLEVGCGAGDLARELAAAGYDVLAIDPDAPDGPIFRRSTIEKLDAAGPFDAVVASRSLHHVSDLSAALDRMAAVLRNGGVVVIDDFAWERLDARAAARVGIALDEWREEHAELHTSDAMVGELDKRFERRRFSWDPYLFRESREVVSEGEERNLIETGEIQAIGFRYVGVRPDVPGRRSQGTLGGQGPDVSGPHGEPLP
jgi:ubiquinone/menaquinone biosynthesis C-methylase UbiE